MMWKYDDDMQILHFENLSHQILSNLKDNKFSLRCYSPIPQIIAFKKYLKFRKRSFEKEVGHQLSVGKK